MTNVNTPRDGHNVNAWEIGIDIKRAKHGNIRLTFHQGRDEIWRPVRNANSEAGLDAEAVGDEWIIFQGQLYIPLCQVI